MTCEHDYTYACIVRLFVQKIKAHAHLLQLKGACSASVPQVELAAAAKHLSSQVER